MLNVLCVLRSGPEYRIEHVAALADGVRRNLMLPYRFLCLTDQFKEVEASGVEAIRLPQTWPGWFAKICLWCPGPFEGDCFYLDLDTRIVGPLDDIVLGHRLTVLRNFWAESYGEPARIGSGLLAWSTNRVDMAPVYEAFCKSPDRFIREYRTKQKWGDQSFLKDHAPVPMDCWQDKHPGRVVSFKKHVLPNRGVPAGASVCCFHGLPRPWALPSFQRAWFDAGGVKVNFNQTKVRLPSEPQWIE